MEFQEAVMKLTTHKTVERNGGPKKLNRWTIISFRKYPASRKPTIVLRRPPVSGSLMADPVIFPSGHSFLTREALS